MTSYSPLYNAFNQDPPDNDPNGRWACVVDRKDFDDAFEQFGEISRFPFLEVHEGCTWDRCNPSNRKVVFRISDFIRGEVRLGECVILDRESVQQLHDHLGQMLSQMK